MSHCAVPPQPTRVRSTCDVCLEAKVRCSRDRPACRRCLHHGRDCVYSNKRRLGRPRGTTSRSRAASHSTDSAGPCVNLPVDEAARLANAPYAGGFSDILPHHLGSDTSQFSQQHPNLAAGDKVDYPSYPVWQTVFSSNQAASDTSGHGFALSSRFESRLDHDQHQIVSSAHSEPNSGSLGVETNALLASSNTTNGSNHVRSSLELTQEADFGFSTMLLRPVYNTLDNGQTILLPVMTTGYALVDSSMPITNMHTSACCSCYSDILLRLSELKQNNSGVSTSELDQIMRLEMDIRIQILAMIRCESCLFERPRALLLVGVVLESVLDLLECACVSDAPTEASEHAMRPSMGTHTSSSGSGSSRSSEYSYQMPPSSASYHHGQYGMCPDERAGTFRRLVRTRLREVLGLTQHLHQHVQTCRSWASNLAAADTTMAEIGNRVCALMDRLEG